MSGNLLPTNATAWEKAVADTIDDFSALHNPVERIRSAKLVAPEQSFVPFLVHEYGLGELTPYVFNQYDLLRDGVAWQRLRGTPAAVRLGLSWLALEAAIVEARTDRRFWNSFQLYLASLPGADAPDLERIENVASLSVALRSKLRRVVHGYDVPMLVADRGRLDRSMLDSDSGVALRADGTRWSFGRAHEIEHVLLEAEGTALGNWIEPPDNEDADLTWQDMDYPWTAAAAAWDASAGTARRRSLASWFNGRQAYLRLHGANGVIGHRRARGTHAVRSKVGGMFSVAGISYVPSAQSELVYIEALTGFGDGAPTKVTKAELVFGAAIVGKPGVLWLGPGALTGGTVVASHSFADPIELRATVRQRFKFLLRF